MPRALRCILSPSKTKPDDTASRLQEYHGMILLTPCCSTPYRGIELQGQLGILRAVAAPASNRRRSQVKRKSVLALIVVSGAAAVLSGCYVVPIDGRQPIPQQLAAPGSSAVVIPGPQPVPATLEARLYPLNEMAGKMGALTATVVDRVN